jgi:hypothetical protein
MVYIEIALRTNKYHYSLDFIIIFLFYFIINILLILLLGGDTDI